MVRGGKGTCIEEVVKKVAFLKANYEMAFNIM